jgi:xylulokinase
MLLGIDIGTSSVKAVLLDVETAQLVAAAGREYPIHKPAPDRAEQDADDWWRAAVISVQQSLNDAGHRDVAAISLCGQMHGGVLLDEAGNPLAPAIIWPDQRSPAEVEELINTLGAETYTAIAGTLPAVGFMGPSLRWLAKHDPALLERAHHILLPKDYLRLRLTGEIAAEISDAAATGLFDVAAGDWSERIIQAAELPERIFPPVLASTAVAGQLTARAAEALGLQAGIPVVAGCADQPAQGIANGLTAPGRTAVTTGSGGQVFTPLRPAPGQRLPTDPRVHVFNHAAPQTWYILGAILTGGLALRWLRDLTGLDGLADAYERLSAEAAEIPPGADGLLFQPYLAGERTPHMDPLARGSFVGLSYHHTRGHLARAVMEGVAFALRQTLEINLSLSAPVESLIAAGGAMESPVWRGIHADIFGLPLQKTLVGEQTGMGAAMLAGVGAGIYPGFDEASAAITRYGPPTEPDAQRHSRYNLLYQQFLSLYPTLRADFHRLARFTLADDSS